MKYEPRKKRIKPRTLLLGMVALGLMVVALSQQNTNKETQDPFTICDFDPQVSLEAVHERDMETYPISDYLYYGETLNLFKDPYLPERKDGLVSKSVTLTNLCTQETNVFILENNRDRQIALDTLTPGLYTLHVNDQMVKKRITSVEPIDSSFTTITRENQNHHIRLFSDEKVFNHPDVQTGNQLFIAVEPTQSEEYDLFIDPLLYNYDFSYVADPGYVDGSIASYQLNFEYAQALKTKLESYGLKVLLSKESADTLINTYGEDGRLKKAYDSKAKYYLAINFPYVPYPSISGPEIQYSANTSMIFANSVMYELKKQLKLVPSTYYSPTGIFASSLVTGVNGKTIYGNNLYLRESGGMATSAGEYSQTTIEGTSSFAANNRYGMQGLQISLGYLSNSADRNRLLNQKDAMVEVLASAIANYLNVEE
ncbi:MAG: N-acetylmuramoyl-L-alanine amidase [Erysipelotrichaceae bacterium]